MAEPTIKMLEIKVVTAAMEQDGGQWTVSVSMCDVPEHLVQTIGDWMNETLQKNIETLGDREVQALQ
jgi:hypothetical protein